MATDETPKTQPFEAVCKNSSDSQEAKKDKVEFTPKFNCSLESKKHNLGRNTTATHTTVNSRKQSLLIKPQNPIIQKL